MKKIFLSLSIGLAFYSCYAQNTFPGTGNVGIGTTSPATLLHLYNSSGNAIVTMERPDNTYESGIKFKTTTALQFYLGTRSADGTDNLHIFSYQKTGGGADVINIDKEGNVGIGTTNPSVPLHVNGTIYSATPVSNSIGIGTTWANNANYNFIGSQGYWGFRTATNMSYNLDAYNGGSPITAMTVLQSGNVGIGTASPNYAKLEVNGVIGSDAVGNNAYYINSSGANYGFLINNSSNVFSLGYGTNPATIGTSVLTWNSSGNVGIGTTTPDTKLSVAGTIHSKEVKVDLIGWPDYVFEPKYNLPSLTSVKNYIDQNHRLPEMPSTSEVLKRGVNLGEMVNLQTKKIEELTLYLLEKDKLIEQQQKLNADQQKINQALQSSFSKMEARLIALENK